MKIRKFKVKDTFPAGNLISKTFSKFNQNEGSKKGVKNYIDYYNPNKTGKEKLEKEFSSTPIFYVAEEKGKIVGIIRGTKNRIINLFVDGNYHGKGIARRLIEKFESQAKKLGSSKIKANVSLFSIGFYQKMRYKKTTGKRNFKGIKVQPMVKKF